MKRIENLKKQIKRLVFEIRNKVKIKNLDLALFLLIFSQLCIPVLLKALFDIDKPRILEDPTTFFLYRLFLLVITKWFFVPIYLKIKKYLKKLLYFFWY